MDIHIGVTFDQNYLHAFYAMSASLKEHHSKGQIHFHCIATGLSPNDTIAVNQWVATFGTIRFYPVDESLTSQFVLKGQWTSAVYYRIFLADLVPSEIKYLLYLDCDIVVIKNLTELYSIACDLPVAAVYDNYVKTQPLIGIHEEGEYFNSGVMLINLESWRENKISEKSIDYLLQHPEHIRFVDQCALNAVLKNNWKKLDKKFNLMYTYIPQELSQSDKKKILLDTAIIHYNLHRPWQMLCRNPFRNFYFHYLHAAGQTRVSKYTDFSIGKIPQWIKIRLVEMYFNAPLILKTWRMLKTKFSR